jgi:hypothetical protein
VADRIVSDPRSCSRCALRPRVPKQRWCGPCHAEYKRLARETRRETLAARNGTQTADHELGAAPGARKAERVVQAGQVPAEKGRRAPAPPAPYVPFTGASPAREPWYAAFLTDLAVNGGISLAAAAAGVHRNRVYRRMEDDPAFAEEIEVAKAYYRDLLEWESVNLARRRDNPLPYFARLKAELPARYIDRQAVFLATNSELPPEDGQRLLQAMFGHGSPIQALESAGAQSALVEGEPRGTGPAAGAS